MTLEHLRTFLTSRRVGNVVVIIFLLVVAYLFGVRHMRFFRIPSSSMEPTLSRVDQIVTLAQDTYERGDIVVVRDPKNTRDYLVKRIIGVGGDQIAVLRGALFINGEYASEPYILEPMEYEIPDPVLVPEDHVFLLGDNRNNSADSHDEGETYATSGIVGRVVAIYYPYERWGIVGSYPLRNRLGQ